MSWGLVAVATVATVSSARSGAAANKAKLAGVTSQLQADAAAWKDNEAENKAQAATNLQNQIRTGYKVGLLNVQQAQAKKKLLERGISLSRSRQEALGRENANAAAAGTIGSSVDAVVRDVESKIGEAQAALDADYDNEVFNFDVQLHDILTSGQDALRGPHNISVPDRAEPSLTGMGDYLMDGVLAAGSAYASSAMRLGLGSGASGMGSSVGPATGSVVANTSSTYSMPVQSSSVLSYEI